MSYIPDYNSIIGNKAKLNLSGGNGLTDNTGIFKDIGIGATILGGALGVINSSINYNALKGGIRSQIKALETENLVNNTNLERIL